MGFLLSLRKFFGRTLPLSACLVLQGCSWRQSSSEGVADESSTLVGDVEGENASEVPEESRRAVRVAPRRPVVTEEFVFEPIPTEPEPSPVAAGNGTTCVVRKGDTLTKIAHRFNVSVLRLMQENQLKNRNKLHVGQVLVIPNDNFGAYPTEACESYRVVRGDTLSKLAKRFNISLFELQQMNGFDRNTTLTVGQIILVPKGSIASSGDKDGIYCVRKGDTLGRIAKKFGITVAKLRERNHLGSDRIYVGQKLYLSRTAPAGKKSSASAKSDASPVTGDTYTVRAGDNLWTIARRCHRSVAELTRLNDLQNPEQLRVGQVLRLKEQSSAEKKVIKTVKIREVSEMHHEVPVETPRSPEVGQTTSALEEDDFKDLFEENKDMPVVPLDAQ